MGNFLRGWVHFGIYLSPGQKLPLAHFNHPPNFNFVGIFWQDGIAGSIGFLFLNQGLIMRFMADNCVNEGRKAAALTFFWYCQFLQLLYRMQGGLVELLLMECHWDFLLIYNQMMYLWL